MTDKDRVLRDTNPCDARALPLRHAANLSSIDKGAQDRLEIVDLDMLRSRFADELAALRETERQTGLAAGRAEARLELEEKRNHDAAALEEQRIRLEAEAEKQTQALQQSQRQLDSVARELKEYHDALLNDLEPMLVEIALAGVLKILGHAAKDRSLVRRLVNTQLSRAAAANPLRIRVSRKDMELIAAGDGAAQEPSTAIFVADDALKPGDCLIETEHGTLDAGIEQQLARFREVLVGTYRGTDS